MRSINKLRGTSNGHCPTGYHSSECANHLVQRPTSTTRPSVATTICGPVEPADLETSSA